MMSETGTLAKRKLSDFACIFNLQPHEHPLVLSFLTSYLILEAWVPKRGNNLNLIN